MADMYTKEKRSQIMASIKSSNSKPEKRVRSLIHKMGYRFRLHVSDMPGKPDIVLPRYKKVIFVHGCFWHGHSGCKMASIPSTNTGFWLAKIETNRQRDKNVLEALEEMGWTSYIVWQCQLKDMDSLAKDLQIFLSK